MIGVTKGVTNKPPYFTVFFTVPYSSNPACDIISADYYEEEMQDD